MKKELKNVILQIKTAIGNHNTMENKRLSSFKIILMGELMVNIPVSILIIIIMFFSLSFGFSWIISCIIGSLAGWTAWSKLIDAWKDWGIKNGVDRDRLFKLGKLGLINFYSHRIYDVEENQK